MKLTIAFLPLLVYSPSLAADPPIQPDFVVATNGSDANPGSAAKPFATLTRARDAVRKLRADGSHKATVTVLVRGGTYALKETLVFGHEDSAASQQCIVYAAYPGEKPILSGGREITGWKKGKGKCWVADVPAARGGGWRFTQLFVNGKRQTRARLPDTDDWRRWWRVDPGQSHAAVFRFPADTLKNWSNVEDVEINLIPTYYWQNQIIGLKAVDEEARTATLVAPTPAYTICAGNPFRAENVREGVTRPGTWSLDTRTGVVTLWPEDGVDPSRNVVTAPVLPLLVRCVGSEADGRLVRGLTFRGLTFTQTSQVPLSRRDPNDTGTLDTNDCSFLLQGATDCAVENCRFVETGGYGVRLRHAATGNHITENKFVGCGGGGVLLTGYGPGTRDVNRGNIIVGNHIHHCGAFFWHACAIMGTQSGENIIAFNHIHDMPYGGIQFADCSVDYFREFRGQQGRGFQFRWKEIGDDPLTFHSVKRFTHSRKNRIVYNTIHDVMQRLHDGGGIHLGFVGGQNIVRGNLIHGVRGSGSGWGLYTDAETNQERIEGNVVWDCNSPNIDYEYGGRNHNKWADNVLSSDKAEPAQARRLRVVIATKRKKGLKPPDVEFAADERPDSEIGYTVQRTDLTGYYPNRVTGRAFVIKGDGTGARQLAPELTRKPNQYCQFAGWSPDGRQAVLYQVWESPANGAWEDKHGAFRFSAEHWLEDIILLDMDSQKTTNLTAVERVSFYNVALGWLENKFSFSAMVDGQLRPFIMDRDGKNKKPQRAGPGFIYGVLTSPDGKRICYHRDYQLYLAGADGRNAKPVKDDNPFHFLPQWSPTGEWLAYLSGQHYNCHPHLIRPDGTGLRKLADRGGYRGVFQPIDKGTDGHSERSDIPTWSPDGKWLYYTAKVGEAVELMRVTPEGRKEQLTRSKPGVFNYLPQVSPDSKWVVFGSTRTGTRQLYVARADGSGEYQLTKVEPVWGAFYPCWRPK